MCSSCRNPVPSTFPAEILLDGVALEQVPTFCNLGNVVGDTGGCIDAITARAQSALKKFRKLLPILTNRNIPLRSRGSVFTAGVHRVLLHASETWPMMVEDTWICSSKIMDKTPVDVLRNHLGISSLDVILRCGRLRWFGHISRMEENN